MNSELDNQDLLANQDSPEFEAYLDDWYQQREAEWAEMEMGKLEAKEMRLEHQLDLNREDGKTF